MENQNIIDKLVHSGAKLLEGPPGEIRVDLKSQRLVEMMGYSTVRPVESGVLSNFCVIQFRNDPSVRPKPTENIEYGVSPIRVRR